MSFLIGEGGYVAANSPQPNSFHPIPINRVRLTSSLWSSPSSSTSSPSIGWDFISSLSSIGWDLHHHPDHHHHQKGETHIIIIITINRVRLTSSSLASSLISPTYQQPTSLGWDLCHRHNQHHHPDHHHHQKGETHIIIIITINRVRLTSSSLASSLISPTYQQPTSLGWDLCHHHDQHHH